MGLPTPTQILIGQLRRATQLRVAVSLDVVETLERRLRFLEGENARLRAEAAVGRPMKRRSPAEWRFRVERWEDVPMVFQPRGEAHPKRTVALRVYTHPDDQTEGPPYWDITKRRVAEVLRPILPQIAGTGTFVKVVQDGDGPTAQFSITIEPA